MTRPIKCLGQHDLTGFPDEIFWCARGQNGRAEELLTMVSSIHALPIWEWDNYKTLFILKIQKRVVKVIFHLYNQQSCRKIFINSTILSFKCVYIFIRDIVTCHPHIFSSNKTRQYKLCNTSTINIPLHST